MDRAEDAWEKIWARSKRNPWRDRFTYPPSLAVWLRQDDDSVRYSPDIFARAFDEYLSELRAEDWELVQIRVIGASKDEFEQPTADRVDVFSFDDSTLIATFLEDDLHSFVQDYETMGWHDIALDPPVSARW